MALSSKQFRQIESAYFGIVKGKENLAEAHRNGDADLIEQYKDYVSSTRGQLADLLPPDLTDDDKQALEMVFEQLSQMTDSGEKDSEYYKQVEGYVDAILPGFADYHNQKSVNAQMRESRIAEVQAREAAYEQRRAASKISVDPKDVAEFGKFQAEHIAKWVVEQAKSGRPSNEIDEKVEEYRLKLRVRANVSQDDIAEFGQAEADFIAKTIAENRDSQKIQDAVEKYRQTLRNKGSVDRTDYTRVDIAIMTLSPDSISSTIRRDGNTDYYPSTDDCVQFIRDAISQWYGREDKIQNLICITAAELMLVKQCGAKPEDIQRLYDGLYKIYKSPKGYLVNGAKEIFDSIFYDAAFSLNPEKDVVRDRILKKDFDYKCLTEGDTSTLDYSRLSFAFEQWHKRGKVDDALYACLENEGAIEPGSDKERLKRELERFGGVGAFGGQKPIDPAKIEQFLQGAQSLHGQFAQERINCEYEKAYICKKQSSDYLLMETEWNAYCEKNGYTGSIAEASSLCEEAEGVLQTDEYDLREQIREREVKDVPGLCEAVTYARTEQRERTNAVSNEARRLREERDAHNARVRDLLRKEGATPWVSQEVEKRNLDNSSYDDLKRQAAENIARRGKH
jgi:hypothetical protein